MMAIYDANRLTGITNGKTSGYLYDNAGNTINDGAKDFVYNQNNRLIKAIENGKTLGEYTYNGNGQRVIKKTGPAAANSASSQNTVYHYDLAGRLIEESTGDGKLLFDYVYLSGKPLAMIRKQGNNEETFYYHNDHLGTPKVLTDKLKKVVWNIELDPFGNEVATKGRQGSYIRNVENNLRFPGQYYDAETGLHYNYFRDYNPKTGRYIEADPVGLKGGMNPFNYAGQDPLNRTDPYGLIVSFNDPRFPAWENDIPSDPAKVAALIKKYWCLSKGDPKKAYDLAYADRQGPRNLDQPGFDLSLRDAEHYFVAYNNPQLALVIPAYTTAKSFGFDYPIASKPTQSEVTWGMRGAVDGLRGYKPDPKDCCDEK